MQVQDFVGRGAVGMISYWFFIGCCLIMIGQEFDLECIFWIRVVHAQDFFGQWAWSVSRAVLAVWLPVVVFDYDLSKVGVGKSGERMGETLARMVIFVLNGVLIISVESEGDCGLGVCRGTKGRPPASSPCTCFVGTW